MFEILSFNSFINKYKDSIDRLGYIENYFKNTCKSVLIENEYVDRDYMIDYSLYYSRAFQPINRFTKRVHYFKDPLDKKTLEETMSSILERNDEHSIKKLKNSYIGFSVIKPILNRNDKKIMGRSVVEPYDRIDGNYKRIYITSTITSNLYGISLETHSLPFQNQDGRVSACATVALWCQSHALNEKFYNIAMHSPYEITKISSEFTSLGRSIPSPGLNIYQITKYINYLGLETEYIDVSSREKLQRDKSIVVDAIKAYVSAGIPILAGLEMECNRIKKYHAVIISGYKINIKNRKIDEIYVHDDGICPYARVKSKNLFYDWDYEWKKMGCSVNLNDLIIPIYPKIRGSFSSLYLYFKRYVFNKLESKNKIPEILLYDNRSFKSDVLKRNVDEVILNDKKVSKKQFLMSNMPNYIWIVRGYENGNVVLDIGFDGTLVRLKNEIFIIKYTI